MGTDSVTRGWCIENHITKKSLQLPHPTLLEKLWRQTEIQTKTQRVCGRWGNCSKAKCPFCSQYVILGVCLVALFNYIITLHFLPLQWCDDAWLEILHLLLVISINSLLIFAKRWWKETHRDAHFLLLNFWKLKICNTFKTSPRLFKVSVFVCLTTLTVRRRTTWQLFKTRWCLLWLWS